MRLLEKKEINSFKLKQDTINQIKAAKLADEVNTLTKNINTLKSIYTDTKERAINKYRILITELDNKHKSLQNSVDMLEKRHTELLKPLNIDYQFIKDEKRKIQVEFESIENEKLNLKKKDEEITNKLDLLDKKIEEVKEYEDINKKEKTILKKERMKINELNNRLTKRIGDFNLMAKKEFDKLQNIKMDLVKIDTDLKTKEKKVVDREKFLKDYEIKILSREAANIK